MRIAQASENGKELLVLSNLSAERGVYTLLLNLKKRVELTPRSGSKFTLNSGIYAYTGSARGKGAASLGGRIRRHLREDKKPFWHIDLLLGCGACSTLAVAYSPSDRRLECDVNKKILSTGFWDVRERFGASDCASGCKGHLVRYGRADIREALRSIEDCHRSVFNREGGSIVLYQLCD